jgi:rubrerythrin
MGIVFNADEVLSMAERIEINAAAFYRKAVELQSGRIDTGFLLKLAVMEEAHRKTFADMRKELSDKEKELTAYDPNSEAAQYLEAMVDGHGGEGAPAVTAKLTGKEGLADILLSAIELEKKSVLFYIGMKDVVPEKLGKGRIDKIIGEEKNHVVILSQELHKVRKS